MSELDKPAELSESGQEEPATEQQAATEAAGGVPESGETPGGEAAISASGEERTSSDEESAELPSPFAATVPEPAVSSETDAEVSKTLPAESEGEAAGGTGESSESATDEPGGAVEAELEDAPEEVSAEAAKEPEGPAEEAGADRPEAEAEPAAETEPAAEAKLAAEAGVEAPAPEPGEESEAVAETAPEPPKPAGVPGIDWYIIHTYSGFENKVKESLRTRADAFGFNDRIGEILIPTEDVVEMRSGKKVTSKRMLYPGYVLLQLKMDDELWHIVKNTPRVTGFVGSGPTPTPLTADEVNQILYRQTSSVESPRPKLTFERSDRVKIIDGPFTNFTGTVEEVNPDRNTLKVMVTIFGRGTPVELEHFQVEREQI